jgi:hypothetical protein
MQHLGALSRRNLLKTGVIGTLAVGLGGIGLTLRETALRADTPELRVFDAREYAILSAIADRLCPPLGKGAPGAIELDTVRVIDDLADLADPDTQRGLKLALRVFESALGGALLGERIAPFTQLDDAGRDRVLAAWRDSRIGFRRTVYRALSSTIQAAYWGDPRTWARLAYDGPPKLETLRHVYADNLVELDSLRHHDEQGS